MKTAILTFASTKGGVGKTTALTNVAAALGQSELRVLVVDADPQGSATQAFGLPGVALPQGFEPLLLQSEKQSPVADLVALPTGVRNVQLIPVTRDGASDLAYAVTAAKLPHDRLRRRLRSWLKAAPEPFDIVLVDTPGHESVLVDQGIFAADGVVGVYEPETWSARGVAQLRARLEDQAEDGAAPLVGLIENNFDGGPLHRTWSDAIRRREAVLGSIRHSRRIPASQTASRGIAARPLVARSQAYTVSQDVLAIATRLLQEV